MMGLAKFVTVLWPLTLFVSVLSIYVLFRRPLGRILKRFDCNDVLRIRIGPVEIEKQSRSKRARTVRGTKKRPMRP